MRDTYWQFGIFEDVRLARASVTASFTSVLSEFNNLIIGGRPSEKKTKQHNKQEAFRVYRQLDIHIFDIDMTLTQFKTYYIQ